jgi:4-amino-4-deoxy-L-arabinose transferase-like glycosyltransferase
LGVATSAGTSGAPTPIAARAFAAGVVAIALLGGGLRLAIAEATHPVRLVGDEVYYAQVAAHLASGRGHLYVGGLEGEARAWRPPGHPFLLSRVLDPERARVADAASDPKELRALVRLELLVGTLLVAATALLGAALFDARSGLVAGAIAALHPALVAQGHMLWSEGLFSLLVTLSLAAAVRAEARRRLVWPALAGIGFGLGALTRELSLAVAAACAAWWLSVAPREARRAAAANGALLLGLALLVVLPWTLRNASVLGRFVPVSTVGWFALAEGNALEQPEWMRPDGPEQRRFHARYFTLRDEAERLDFARSFALARIRAEQPAWAFRKALRNLALLLSPDEVLRTKLRRGAYGDLAPAPIRALLATTIPVWIALYVAAAAGIAAARAGGRRRLAVLVLALVAAVHVAANATARFRLPWLPLLAVYASHALLGGRSTLRRIDRAGAIGALAALAFLFAVAIPYYARFGGRP